MLDTTYRERLKNKSLPQLKRIATDVFNAWIRERDKDKGCVSCDSKEVSQASHLYSAGHHAGVRFNEDNVSGSCLRCNLFLRGNLNMYRIRLIERIGEDKVKKLDFDAAYYTKHGYKWDRQTLIEIIIKYK